MATYEVEMNGQKYEVEAPDEQSLSIAVKQLQSETAAPQPAAPDGGGVAGALNSFGTGIADMATFGFADEIGAGARWAGGKVLPWQSNITYDQALDEVRGANKQAEAANPGTYLAGQITGGVGSAAKLAQSGLSLTARLAPNASMLARVGAGAAEGAAMGGAYGVGSGEGAEDRTYKGLENAAVGGIMGGAMPVIARGASAAYRNIADRVAASRVAQQTGFQPEVSRMVSNVLEADGTLGPQGMANMDRAGAEAMLADAGPNARSVLDTAIQRGGPGAVSARSAIDARVARGSADINSALDGAFGAPEGVETARAAIREGTAGARSGAYNAAYATPIDYAAPHGQAIEGLVKSRVPASVIHDANRLMRLEGHESKQILAKIAEDGSVVYEKLPDVRQLDYITRALNQAAESGDGAGALGGQTTIGRAYQNLSREIRQNLRTAVPEYGNALDTAADPIRRSQAVQLGSKLLSPSMSRDQVANAVDGMSAAEREALAQGIRSRFDDTLANVTRTVADGDTTAREGIKALKDMSSRASRQKVIEAIGQERAKPLFDELDRVATSFELRASVAENSKTFARQAVSGRIDEITAPGAIGTLAQGKPLNAAQRVAQALTGQTPERIAVKQNEIYSQIADLLTRPRDQAIPAFQAMTNYGNQSVANQARAARIAELISSGRHLGYPASAQITEELR